MDWQLPIAELPACIAHKNKKSWIVLILRVISLFQLVCHNTQYFIINNMFSNGLNWNVSNSITSAVDCHHTATVRLWQQSVDSNALWYPQPSVLTLNYPLLSPSLLDDHFLMSLRTCLEIIWSCICNSLADMPKFQFGDTNWMLNSISGQILK